MPWQLQVAMAVLGMAGCGVWAIRFWLEPKNDDGCWLKLPGHIRQAERKRWRKPRKDFNAKAQR